MDDTRGEQQLERGRTGGDAQAAERMEQAGEQAQRDIPVLEV